MSESNLGVTVLLAWWGAIVSTGLGIIRVVEFFRDRAKVVVKYKIGWRVTPNLFGYNPTKDYVVVEVLNKGRRPVTITNVGAISKAKGEKDFILADSFRLGPRELAEGKAITYLLEQEGLDLSRFKCFVAFDMTGRHYKCSIKSDKK